MAVSYKVLDEQEVMENYTEKYLILLVEYSENEFTLQGKAQINITGLTEEEIKPLIIPAIEKRYHEIKPAESRIYEREGVLNI